MKIELRGADCVGINWVKNGGIPGVGRAVARSGLMVPASQKFCFILFRLKGYPTYDLLAFMTEMDHSQPCRWVQGAIPWMCAFVLDGTERPANPQKPL